jgi:hypothetical protein
MIKINTVLMPYPKSFKVDISDIDGETNRNAKGDTIRDRIAVKRKLSCEWPPLTQAQISTLLNAVATTTFLVEYPDPITATTTKTFLVRDKSAPLLTYIGGVPMWESLSMELIEK